MILRLIFVVLFLGVMLEGYSQSVGQPGSELSYGTEQGEYRENIKLYPNPAPDYLYVELGMLESANVSLSVHNVIGNEIRPEVETIDEHQVRVTVKDLSPGYYFLSVKDNASKFRGIFKFLKP